MTNKHVFAYFYFTNGDETAVGDAVEAHKTYWHETVSTTMSGGPFGDFSGGMILYHSESIEEALDISKKDPFVRAGLVTQSWVKEWLIQPNQTAGNQ